eukprot:300467_1
MESKPSEKEVHASSHHRPLIPDNQQYNYRNESNANKCQKIMITVSKLINRVFGENRHTSRSRFWYILTMFIISAYLMCIANVLTEYRYQHHQIDFILQDLGFDFAEYATPNITKWIHYPDITVNICIVFMLLWILFDGPKQQKIAVFRRWLTMLSILYIGRAVCVVSTQMPTPFHSNKPTTWNEHLLYEAPLVFVGSKTTNQDVFYSGHTVVISLCAMTIHTYSTRKWLIFIFWIFSLFGLYVIIATKFHYTIDVIIAFVLSVIIWKLYHMAMSIKEIRNYFPIFKWFESDKEVEVYAESISVS